MISNQNSVSLETSRLTLIPLTYQQLVRYADLDDSIEMELGLVYRKRTLTKEFKMTIQEYLIPYLNQHKEHLLYATIWIIINRYEKVIVGDIGFNAAPSEKGVIEVGYSTYPDFMNQGYMTEALQALTKWAFNQPGVEIIIAQTDKDNFPTHRVLSKNNFQPFAEADSFYWWRLDKEDKTVEDS